MASGSDDEHMPCINFNHNNLSESKCAIAKENTHSVNEACRNDAGFFNYLEFNYCTMDGMMLLSMFIMVHILFLSFGYISY